MPVLRRMPYVQHLDGVSGHTVDDDVVWKPTVHELARAALHS